MELLAETLEALDHVEVDYDGKMLQIFLPNGLEYLINFHGTTSQIWLASPVSGAHHFDYRAGNWHSTRQEISLNVLLAQELKDQLGHSVDI